MDRREVCILVPAHREAHTIGPVVAEARRYGTVIVVDDCSPDNTGEVAAANGAIVVRNEYIRGYDGSLNRLFEEAAARHFYAAITIDADGEHDPQLVAGFRKALLDDNFALVIGVRPHKQRLSEIIVGWYIKKRYGVDDILCGMKGYQLQLWHGNGGFDRTNSIGTELAINSIRRGVPFRQLPVRGNRRQDAPRFGRALMANWRILAALARVLLHDINLGGTWSRTRGTPQ